MQQENASVATQKVKEGVSSFLGGISKVLVISPDDDYQLTQIVGGEAVVFDRYKVDLGSLQPVFNYHHCRWTQAMNLCAVYVAVSLLLMLMY